MIVELDGNPNGDYIQIEKDIIRDRYLEELGLAVPRFENKLVFPEPEFDYQWSGHPSFKSSSFVTFHFKSIAEREKEIPPCGQDDRYLVDT